MNLDTRLTTSQAAKLLGVSSGAIRRWCDGGYLKHYKLPVGKFRRIVLKELILFANKNNVPLDESIRSIANGLSGIPQEQATTEETARV